ncbi:hypothetical protein C1T30_43635, partial [Bacillus sp. MBGLi97]
ETINGLIDLRGESESCGRIVFSAHIWGGIRGASGEKGWVLSWLSPVCMTHAPASGLICAQQSTSNNSSVSAASKNAPENV